MDHYCVPRKVDGREMTMYEIWEAGGAFGDSVTPSTFNREYRLHAARKILSAIGPRGTVLSFGCGDAAVEGELVRHGLSVRAIDVNEGAVSLACAKGVDARVCDYFDLDLALGAGVDLFYADGFLGHLFSPEIGLRGFFEKIRSLKPGDGAHLLVSNDAPASDAPYGLHQSVSGFWFLSHRYLASAVEAAGLRVLEAYSFPYRRPLSGIRDRSIVLARWPTR